MAGELLRAQFKFARMNTLLENYIHSSGYCFTHGDMYRDPRVHGEFGEKKSYAGARSVHKLKLASDKNLFRVTERDDDGNIIDAVMLTGVEATRVHNHFHDFWDSIGGAKRLPRDLNHYSMPWGRYR